MTRPSEHLQRPAHLRQAHESPPKSIVERTARLGLGHDVRDIELQSLREQVCYAPPSPFLFDTTLADNLRLGKITASDAELEEVMECVGLTAWVSSLEGGLNQQAPGRKLK